MTDQYKILLIVPAYNEQDSICSVVDSIIQFAPQSKYDIDYVVINDCSTDNTEDVLRQHNINHISLSYNLGIGGAVQTGYMYAFNNNYDIAIQVDGDGQHNVSCVDKLVEPIINRSADMTIGSRFTKDSNSEFKSSSARRAGIKLLSFAIKKKTGKDILDTTSGFRAANKDVIELFSKNYPRQYPEPISSAEVLLSDFKVEEIGVTMNEREHGKSSIASWKSAYYMINTLLSIFLLKVR